MDVRVNWFRSESLFNTYKCPACNFPIITHTIEVTSDATMIKSRWVILSVINLPIEVDKFSIADHMRASFVPQKKFNTHSKIRKRNNYDIDNSLK